MRPQNPTCWRPLRAAGAQQADPAILQRLIPVLQAQRNEWLDRAALAEARAAQLAEEVQRLKSELEKAKTEKRAQ